MLNYCSPEESPTTVKYFLANNQCFLRGLNSRWFRLIFRFRVKPETCLVSLRCGFFFFYIFHTSEQLFDRTFCSKSLASVVVSVRKCYPVVALEV